MTSGSSPCNRREFLRRSAVIAASLPWGLAKAADIVPVKAGRAKVAIVSCRQYGAAVRTALAQAFDLIGGIGRLVKQKTVTVKINLTGSDFTPILGRSVGETYMTHPDTAVALASLLFEAGARRVQFVESTQARQPLEETLVVAGWDVKALQATGSVEFENTRNLGRGRDYQKLKVFGRGKLFTHFELNPAYTDTDVMVSLCKLKQHAATGITLTMKNMFGITPNSLYGDESPNETATAGRGRLHDVNGGGARENPMPYDPPGATEALFAGGQAGTRIPRIITDICGARPIHLGIIDGITSMSGGEGPWITDRIRRVTTPGVLIVGLDPVATDAVGTAVMGFDNPRAPRGVAPFGDAENQLVLAEQAGLGTADLARIEVVGRCIADARCTQYRK